MKDGSEIIFRLRQIQSLLRDPLRKTGFIKDFDWQGVSPIFIISTGRTGTHFFSHFFTENFKGVYATHEPKPDVFEIAIHFVKGQISAHRAKVMQRDYRKAEHEYIQTHGIHSYVESNNNLSYMIPVLLEEFKEFKIIHIQRDGRDVVRSLYSRMAEGKWVGRVPFLSERDPRDRLKSTFFQDDPYYSKWGKMSHFEKICWYWAKKDSLIFQYTQDNPHAKILKFENLFKQKDLNLWQDIIQFVGLEDHLTNPDILAYIEGSKSNQVKDFNLPKWPDWSQEQKEQFSEIAGPHMKAIGYDLEGFV